MYDRVTVIYINDADEKKKKKKKYTRQALFFIIMINYSFPVNVSLTLNNIIEVVKNK